MTDFLDDADLGQRLRAEVPARGDDYWDRISIALGTADAGAVAPQSIDVDGDPTVVPFKSRLQRGFGGIAALAIAAGLLVVIGVLVGTRVQRSNESIDAGFAQQPGTIITDPELLETLPGPQQNLDHWHAVYGVWDCTAADGSGGWLPAFQSTQDDTGIHSHGDGMIYIHPFFEESAGRNATFSHFASEMQFELTDSGVVLDDGRTLLEGTLCDDQPAVLHLRRWQSDVTARTERVLAPRIITENLGAERFYNDREVWVLAFAPLDADIPLPPIERFAALDDWTAPEREAPPIISASAAVRLDASVVLPLRHAGPAVEYIEYEPGIEPETVFDELTRDPRPEWTNIIIADTFRPFARVSNGAQSALVLTRYRIQLSSEETRACMAAIDIDAQAIAGASYCGVHPITQPLVDEAASHLFVRNAPKNAEYVVIRTENGERIVTNPVERHVYVRYDFAADPVDGLTFFNDAFDAIVTCPRGDSSIEPPCMQVLRGN